MSALIEKLTELTFELAGLTPSLRVPVITLEFPTQEQLVACVMTLRKEMTVQTAAMVGHSWNDAIVDEVTICGVRVLLKLRGA